MSDRAPPVGIIVEDYSSKAQAGDSRQAKRRASFMERYNAQIALKERLQSQENAAISGAPQQLLANDPAAATIVGNTPVVYQDVAPHRPLQPQLEADAHIQRLTQAIHDVKQSGLNEKDVRVVASRIAAYDPVSAYELLRGTERLVEARDRQGKDYVKQQKAIQAQRLGEWVRDFRLRHPHFNHIADNDLGPLMDSAGLGQPVLMQQAMSTNMLHRVAAMDTAAEGLSVYLERIGARTIPQRTVDPMRPQVITEGSTPHSAAPSRQPAPPAPASLQEALRRLKSNRKAARIASQGSSR